MYPNPNTHAGQSVKTYHQVSKVRQLSVPPVPPQVPMRYGGISRIPKLRTHGRAYRQQLRDLYHLLKSEYKRLEQTYLY